jgi:RND superfamily putative drug exporter
MNPNSGFLRWRRLIVAGGLLLAIAALPLVVRVNAELDASARLSGSESARVADALRDRFHSPYTQIALLRLSGVPSPRSAQGRPILADLVAALRASADVEGVTSYLDREDSLFVGEDGSALLVVGLNTQQVSAATALAALHETTDAMQRRLRTAYPTAAVEWTGEAVVNADIRRTSADETRTAELRVLPLTVLLLWLAFRSPIAALLPLACGALTILLALAGLEIINRHHPVSVIAVSIVSMVGIGLSIDYALLIVSRYRDALARGLSRTAAVAEASAEGGRTIAVSGATVAIGFAALLIVRVSDVRSIAIGGLLVSALAVAMAATVVPVLLSIGGAWIDRTQTGGNPTRDAHGYWRRWAIWVTRHPLAVLCAGGIPLLLLASQMTALRVDLPRGRWLPESAESVRILHDIESVARGNFGQIVNVILVLPAGDRIQDEAGWRAESRLTRRLARDPRIQHVWSVSTLSTAPMLGPELLTRLPEGVRRRFVSEDGQLTLIELLPRKTLATRDAVALARELRALDVDAVTGLHGARIEVGGIPAFNADYLAAVEHAMLGVAACVVCITLVALALAFRSVLIPLKAVALNLLSVAAAFGAVSIVFQRGIGASLIGLSRPMDGVFPIVPVVVFCIVFGLSMDYEVFLVAQMARLRRLGLGDRDALVEGLASTGRVISYAAAIMVAVFGAFVAGEFALIKILGFALAVAVLVDATVIRLAVGPALIVLAGRWNWWPGTR